MLRQMQESTLSQMLHVHKASDMRMIQYSDWSKQSCALERYPISCLLSDKTSFQMVRQTSCRYVNCDNMCKNIFLTV